jgi:hypothetical protein
VATPITKECANRSASPARAIVNTARALSRPMSFARAEQAEAEEQLPCRFGSNSLAEAFQRTRSATAYPSGGSKRHADRQTGLFDRFSRPIWAT